MAMVRSGSWRSWLAEYANTSKSRFTRRNSSFERFSSRLSPPDLLEQARVVHGDPGLRGDACHNRLVGLVKPARRGMAEEKPAQQLSGPRHDRRCEIAAHRRGQAEAE